MDNYLKSVGERLKNKFGKMAPDPSSLTEKGVKRELTEEIESAIDRIQPYAAKEMGVSKKELHERLRERRFVFNADLVGSTSTSDGWDTFDIQLNLGLTQFYFHAVKVFASRIGVMKIDGHPGEDSQIPLESSSKALKAMMTAFFEMKLLAHIGLSITDLSENQLIIADKLLKEIKSFIIAHEFGHIVIHTKNSKVYEVDAANTLIEQLLSESNKLSTDENNRIKGNWSEEVAADFIGVKLALALHTNDMDRILAYSSCELFFIILNMLEEFHAKILGKSPSLITHPPGNIRLAFLRLAARDNDPSAHQMGQSFEQIAKWLLERTLA